MRGAPPRAIQELAGHRELGMTQRHMHLSPAALDSAIRLLNQPLAVQSFEDIVETERVSEGREPERSAYTLRAAADNLRGVNEFAGLPAEARSRGRRAKAGGEAGIRTLGRSLKPLQRFSKPPLSATQPPHRGPISIRQAGIYSIALS